MDWHSYLPKLSHHLLANLEGEELEEASERASIIDYLGRPPSPTEQIEKAQFRLGFELPASLRSFYLVSDGWYSANGFPVGIANILSVSDLSLFVKCQTRELEIFSNYVQQNFGDSVCVGANSSLESCVVIIDFDGNELGFAVRTESIEDWPVVTYNPDGGDFETYNGFIELMKQGLTF